MSGTHVRGPNTATSFRRASTVAEAVNTPAIRPGGGWAVPISPIIGTEGQLYYWDYSLGVLLLAVLP